MEGQVSDMLERLAVLSHLMGAVQRDANCTAAVEAAGILGREGSAFGGDSEHVRLELLMRQEDFELMADKLQHAAGQ